MARRVQLLCLGATMAPYGTHQPVLPNGGVFPPGLVSEYLNFTTDQLQIGVDATAAQLAQYPFALHKINVKFVDANHFKSSFYWVTINGAAVNALCNTGD